MRAALAVCRRGIAVGESPFGAVIASQAGAVVCATHNTVRSTGDPTAHAEINAIRAACRLLGTIDLSGHVIVSTCEPCPMCAAAIHWANLDAVCFGAGIDDAGKAGFRELALPVRTLYAQGGSSVMVHPAVMRAECQELFAEWRRGPHPDPY